jgi:O-antigen ligase
MAVRNLEKMLGAWVFGLFLFAGYYKADPRLSFIQSEIDITLLLLVLSFLLFLYRVLTKPVLPRIPAGFVKVAACFLFLAGWLLGSSVISGNMGYGLDKALKFIVFTGWAFFGTAFFITDFQSLRHISWVIVTISTVMAIDALFNYPGVGRIGFVSALGSNYIALARAGGFGLLVILTFWFPAKTFLPGKWSPVSKIFLVVMAAVQFWATLSAGSRGPVLALTVVLLLFFGSSVRGFLGLKSDRSTREAGIVLLCAILVIYVVGQNLFAALFFRSQVLITDLGEVTRIALYKEAIKVWAESPIWGVGSGGFAVAVTGSEFAREYPHNILLELAAETGIVGVAVFATMVYVAFSVGWAMSRNSQGLALVATRYLVASAYFALLNAMVSGDINDNRLVFVWLGLMASATRFRSFAGAGFSASLSKLRVDAPESIQDGSRWRY